MTSLHQYVAQANTRANKNREALHSAWSLAQLNTPDPLLTNALQLAGTANTVVIIMLDTILEYLKHPPSSTQP